MLSSVGLSARQSLSLCFAAVSPQMLAPGLLPGLKRGVVAQLGSSLLQRACSQVGGVLFAQRVHTVCIQCACCAHQKGARQHGRYLVYGTCSNAVYEMVRAGRVDYVAVQLVSCMHGACQSMSSVNRGPMVSLQAPVVACKGYTMVCRLVLHYSVSFLFVVLCACSSGGAAWYGVVQRGQVSSTVQVSWAVRALRLHGFVYLSMWQLLCRTDASTGPLMVS